MIIYLDIDDVVADWTGAAQEYLGKKWDSKIKHLSKEDWVMIRDHARFYRNLPLKENAHDLVNWCKRYCEINNVGLRFLTAIPHDNDMPWAIQDKVFWAHERFPGIPVFMGPYSADKYRHCRIGDVLIDDREINCKQWAEQGGLAHVYTNWIQCKYWLENVLPFGSRV